MWWENLFENVLYNSRTLNLCLIGGTYHRTFFSDAGFASYSQNSKNSPVSLTVKLSGLTVTTGGSIERQIFFLTICMYFIVNGQ